MDARRLLRKLRLNVYDRRKYVLIEKDLWVDAPGEIARPGPAIEVREGSPEELAALRPGEERRSRTYLARGSRCAVALVDGEPAAWCWWLDRDSSAGSGRADHQLAFFGADLGEGDAWCFDYLVLPAYQARGRATLVLRELEQVLARRGYTRMLGYVDADNVPARWLYRISGHRTVRTVTARYYLRYVGVANGRLVVRVNQRREPATFLFRPLLGWK